MSFSAFKKYWSYFLFVLFLVASVLIVQIIKREEPTNFVTVAFLNVGQGDAIYIESPTHAQLLVDGGPAHNLLAPLSKVMPWYDKLIDGILVTNPDTDHYAGFMDLFDRFNIKKEIEPGTKTETETHKVFQSNIVQKNIQKFIAQRGMKINLGGGAELTILYPDHDVSHYSTNDGSIIAKLTYGSTSVMFTGDAPSPVEEYVLDVNGSSTIKSTLLKIGHHGSRTSASQKFFEAVNPEAAIISAGLKNTYGHPHKETIQLLESLKIPTLITLNEGTIIFYCNKNSCIQKI